MGLLQRLRDDRPAYDSRGSINLNSWNDNMALRREAAARIARLEAALTKEQGDHLTDNIKMGTRIERLEAEAQQLDGHRKALAAESDHMRARIGRLEAALQWLMKQPWKSIDKDNMEFQVTVSCYVRDALLAALAGTEGP